MEAHKHYHKVLELIEQIESIERIPPVREEAQMAQQSQLYQSAVLALLYQAAATERLEMTLRTIGILLEEKRTP
jgi:hypothetical protein